MQISAQMIEQSLKALRDLPMPVLHWQVETGTDWTEDTAIWVWGFLDDPKIDTAMQLALRKAIRNFIRDQTGDDVTVYIRFRAASDLAQTT